MNERYRRFGGDQDPITHEVIDRSTGKVYGLRNGQIVPRAPEKSHEVINRSTGEVRRMRHGHLLENEKGDMQQKNVQRQLPQPHKKKMGIAVALLLVLVASSYDTLDFLTTFIGDDYWILDILYFPTTIGFWLYFRMKKINKRGLFLLAYLAEWVPVVDVLNLQTVYALIIIWTNMTKTGEKMANSVPIPKMNPLPKAA